MSTKSTFNHHVEDALGSGDHNPVPARQPCPTARALLAARSATRASDAVRPVRADRFHEEELLGRDG